jgi:hypothetical protein
MTPNRALLINLICQGITWETSSDGSGGSGLFPSIDMGVVIGFGIID